MKVAVASPPYPTSIDNGLFLVETLAKNAVVDGAEIVCFPESYIPGYPLPDRQYEQHTREELESALDKICKIAASNSIAIIIPMDWHSDSGLLNVAHVVSAKGEVLGHQTKNQLDPSEDELWVPGTERHIFEINGLKFGISICHEGFRYPESVRWAARRDAQIVFHPHFAGNDDSGVLPVEWGSMDNPYYEKAMMMRALENTIYFASSNYATRFPESASSIISPDGRCLGHVPYGQVGVCVKDIDINLATGYLAKRLRPELYPDV